MHSVQPTSWMLASPTPVAAIVLVLGLLTHVGAAGQEILHVSDDRSCQECGIRATHLVRLGDRDLPGAIESDVAIAARDGRGRFYVTEAYGTRIKVFDPAGRFLRTIGRKGAGPGEFQDIGTIKVVGGDSLFVFDNGNLRYTVLDSAYAVAAESPLQIPPYIEAAVFEGGGIVLASPVRTPERVGLPLHYLGRDGRVKRSFGSDRPNYRSDIPYIDARGISKAPEGRVWSAYRNQYVIELWDTAGQHLLDVRRAVDWFPSGLRRVDVDPHDRAQHPPDPHITSIREEDGILWVAVLIADPEWREALQDDDGFHGASIADVTRYRDTIVEAVDLATGRLLGSARVDQPLTGFIGDGLATATILDDIGIPYVHVWHFSLTSRGKK